MPVIYISRDMAEVEHLAGHLVMMERRTITATGPMHSLPSDPALPLAARREAAVSVDAAVGGYGGLRATHPPPQRCAAAGFPLRRLHLACASGCVRPATSSSHAKRRAQAPSSMSFRRGLKLVFRSARLRSLWCLRLAPAAQVRTFWRASRVTRLIRCGSRMEWTYSPSSSTSLWSRPLKRHQQASEASRPTGDSGQASVAA